MRSEIAMTAVACAAMLCGAGVLWHFVRTLPQVQTLPNASMATVAPATPNLAPLAADASRIARPSATSDAPIREAERPEPADSATRR